MNIARRLLGLGAFVLVLVGGWRFASQNSAPVTVVVWPFPVQEGVLWQALGLAFAFGACMVGLVAVYLLTRTKLIARRYRASVADLEAEVHQLRSLPLADATGSERGSAVPANTNGSLGTDARLVGVGVGSNPIGRS